MPKSHRPYLPEFRQPIVELVHKGRAREHASAADEQLGLTLAHYIEGIMDELRGSVVLRRHPAARRGRGERLTPPPRKH